MADVAQEDSNLTEEQRLFQKKYGRLPPQPGPLNRLNRGNERKFFDSADHALSTAGIKSETGKVIATANNIPSKKIASRPDPMQGGGHRALLQKKAMLRSSLAQTQPKEPASLAKTVVAEASADEAKKDAPAPSEESEQSTQPSQ